MTREELMEHPGYEAAWRRAEAHRDRGIQKELIAEVKELRSYGVSDVIALAQKYRQFPEVVLELIQLAREDRINEVDIELVKWEARWRPQDDEVIRRLYPVLREVGLSPYEADCALRYVLKHLMGRPQAGLRRTVTIRRMQLGVGLDDDAAEGVE